MSAQDTHKSPPVTEDAIDRQATQPQTKPRQSNSANDDKMNHDDSSVSSEGSYREQDYGGEPTHPPTEPEAA
ncbi:MAG TPA: hypothetical protein VGD69_20430 [Herpetosiphonaceae bacterium]